MNKTYPYQNLSLEDMPNEVWRDVVGYEGLYQVSNLARVKSLRTSDSWGRRRIPFIKKQTLGANGYFYVHLQNGDKKENFTVHSLVATAFLEKNGEKLDVDHIDCNRKNNVVTNLRWCTRGENMLNPITNKRMRETLKRKTKTEEWKKHHEKMNNMSKTLESKKKWHESIKKNGIMGKKMRKPVIQMDLEGNVIREYDGVITAKRETKIVHISSCCRGIRKSAGGYLWKYKN